MTSPEPQNLLNASQDLLGWRLIQKALADHCSSPATSKVCESLHPEETYPAAKIALEETEEIVCLEESGQPIPIQWFEDLFPIFSEIGKHGVISAEQNLSVLNFLTLSIKVQNGFKKLNTSPHLKVLSMRIDPLQSLRNEFDRYIDPEGNIREDATPELKQAIRSVRTSKSELERELGRLMSTAKVKDSMQDNYFTEREGRLVIPVKSEFKSKMDGIVHDTSGSGATLFVEPAKLVPLNNQLKINHIRVEQEKLRIRKILAESLIQNREALLANQKILVHLDLIYARARLAKTLGARRFHFKPKSRVSLRQARNPELILNGQDVIPNDIDWDPLTRIIIISGPNTGGKTVTLKTTGLMALMARSGMLLPVDEHSEMGFFPHVYADIGDEQNVQRQLSTFSAHIIKIKHILDQAMPGSMILLDELGIATDPDQGAALAEAILLRLKSRDMTTLVSTHYLSLKALAQTREGFLNACMQFDEVANTPTYRLIFGAPGNSAALETAKRFGLFPDIIRTAKDIFNQKDTTADQLLESLHRQKLEMEKEKDMLIQQQEEIKKLRQEQEILIQNLRDEKIEFRKNKAKRLQGVVRQTQNRLQYLLREVKETKDSRKIHEMDKKVSTLKNQLQKDMLPDISNWNIGPDQLRKGDVVIVEGYAVKGRLLENPSGKKSVRVELGKLEIKLEPHRLKGNSRTSIPLINHQNPEPYITFEASSEARPRFDCDLRGMRLEEAKDSLEAFIDQALKNKMSRIKIIHGHGMGTIKNFVRDYLESCRIGKSVTPGLKEDGGDGVTMVEF